MNGFGKRSFAAGAFALALFQAGCPSDTSGSTDANVSGDVAMTEMGDPEVTDALPADPCTGFCRDIGIACTGANAQFADQGACEDTCRTWPAGKAGDTTGNSVQCRIFHLKEVQLMPDEAATHCPHAGVNSDDCN